MRVLLQGHPVVTTLEQFMILSAITAVIVLVLAITLAAVAIWIIEYMPARVRRLRSRLRKLGAWFRGESEDLELNRFLGVTKCKRHP